MTTVPHDSLLQQPARPSPLWLRRQTHQLLHLCRNRHLGPTGRDQPSHLLRSREPDQDLHVPLHSTIDGHNITTVADRQRRLPVAVGDLVLHIVLRDDIPVSACDCVLQFQHQG